MLVKKNTFNSSVLNYPKSCAGKKEIEKKNCSVSKYSKKKVQKLKKISVLNCPKSCAFFFSVLNYSKKCISTIFFFKLKKIPMF